MRKRSAGEIGCKRVPGEHRLRELVFRYCHERAPDDERADHMSVKSFFSNDIIFHIDYATDTPGNGRYFHQNVFSKIREL